MTSMLMAEWKELQRGRPGHRFRERYEMARRSHNRVTVMNRVMRIGLAVSAFAVGVVLVFIPGPAVLFFLIAGTLLAAESRALALTLDRLEVGVRVAAKAGSRQWLRLSSTGRAVVVILGVAVTLAVMAIFWRLAFD